jgi:ubiquinone/menaquinone biosynthesis C-methylase UbiE
MTVTEPCHVPETKGAVIHWAARYDLLVQLLTLGRERVFREKVLGLARLEPGESVLDVGCGTGTLAIAAKRLVGAHGRVRALDPSPEMIARARKKAAKAGLEVTFEIGVAETLPFEDASFHCVLASMMIHHLPKEVRPECFREMRRVLRPHGRMLAVDFGGAGQKRRGLIAHVHGHARFDLLEAVPLISDAGLKLLGSGPVGFGGLQFVLASA